MLQLSIRTQLITLIVIISQCLFTKIVSAFVVNYDYNVAMERQWINHRLIEVGKSKAQLASALGLAPSRITEILNSKREIKVTEIPLLADFLELSVSEVMLCIFPKRRIQLETHPTVIDDTLGALPEQHVYNEPTDHSHLINPTIDRDLIIRTIADVLGYIEATGDVVNSKEACDAIIHLYDESVEDLIRNERKTTLKIGGKTVDFTRNLNGA